MRRVFDDEQRERFVDTVSGALMSVQEPVLSNAFQYWKNVDAETGAKIEAKVREQRGL